MTLKQALSYFRRRLASVYETREAQSLSELSLQHIAGCSRLQLITHSNRLLNEKQIALIEDFIASLLQYCPLQHLIGSTQFCGLSITCSPAALIPRPETEELVAWILTTCAEQNLAAPCIADIGTGTGCMALALKYHLPQARVIGIDSSNRALDLAQRNGGALQLSVEWQIGDMLHIDMWTALPECHIVVSNPPYIAQREIANMPLQVTAYEPHTALFVPDNDPLQYYRAIAIGAKRILSIGGYLFVETHEAHAFQTANLFMQCGYEAAMVRPDINGKNRMIRAMTSGKC